MDHIKNSPNPQQSDFPSVRQSLTLNDPNETAALTPWETDFRPLGRGPTETRLDICATPCFSVLRLDLSERIHQLGASPADQLSFAIAAPERLQDWQRAVPVAHPLFCFGAGQEFDCVSEAGFTAHVLSVAPRDLRSFAEGCGFALPIDLEHPQQFNALDQAPRLGALAGALELFLASAAQMGLQDWRDQLFLQLCHLLAAPAPARPLGPRRLRDKALYRALDLMQAHIDEPRPIADLCREAGASWRSLDRAFKDRYGIGPKAYYSRLRLTQARQALRQRPPEQGISDIANAYGFWHMGQFAQDYRALFGELPSGTVRQN